MTCPKCGKDDPQGREMCPECGAPIKPIPVPPGGKLRFGGYDWYVLDKQDSKTLIITEMVIEKRPYHREETEITWETCDILQYLNGGFYNTFSEADRARIAEVVNENPDIPWYGTPGGNPTVDKIFLLSIDEVVRYFGDSHDINVREKNPGWDWLKDEYIPWFGDPAYNVNRRAVDDDGVVQFYRLRSPGPNPHSVAYVMGFCGDGFDQGAISFADDGDLVDGHIIPNRSGYLSFEDERYSLNGIRPALWLKVGGENMKNHTQAYVKGSFEAAEMYCKAFGAEITLEMKHDTETAYAHCELSVNGEGF
ncbi:hypothetical protein FACS1894105_11390 [Clostridia bacterium]|nr:hypothetical protein FACS1894105_11390 [Clostridia bacterium]